MKKVFSLFAAIVVIIIGCSNVMASSPVTDSFQMGIKWWSNKATTKITNISGQGGVTRNRKVEARLVKWNSYSGTITSTYESSENNDSTTSLTSNLETTTNANSNSNINRSYHHAHVYDGFATAGATFTMNDQYLVTNYDTIYF